MPFGFKVSSIKTDNCKFVMRLGSMARIYGRHFYQYFYPDFPNSCHPVNRMLIIIIFLDSRAKMGKMARLLAAFGFWTLLARQISTFPVQVNLNQRELLESNEHTQTYIIHMERLTATDTTSTLETAHSRYSRLLEEVQTIASEANQESPSRAASVPIHVYETVVDGFSARLTPQEASELRRLNGVLGVLPDTVRSLHTTRTPAFLGLNTLRGLWPQSQFGDDVIVGLLDSGIWPERESFSDEGLGPIPARWKGSCQLGTGWNSSNCNKKIIGARYYSAGYEQVHGPLNETLDSKSPRDTLGHGSHTSSTAAGSAVSGANLNGLANGTARGMAPKARIAMYKVCWTLGCLESDILAGFDRAVADGVDVLSISIGGGISPYDEDNIAIGAFGAVKRGIFVSCAAGNAGPSPGTVVNVAPWIMTVAASTLDRSFPGGALLFGDGMNITGDSWWYSVMATPVALIYGSDVAAGNVTAATLCLAHSLNATMAKGKIVVCEVGVNERLEKGAVVLAAGGTGMVIVNTVAYVEPTAGDLHFLPAIHVGYKEGIALAAYMNSTAAPVGRFQFFGTRLGIRPAPVAAAFSSRGPNTLTPEVLKPDITAPGVNILAAWTGHIGPTGFDIDTRMVDFNFDSGTSMSCPHVGGVGALLKSAHPDWSPSAIKSAMMTTASIIDNTHSMITDAYTLLPGTPWEFGSGHLKPERALDPGLVYDMDFQDYVNFLCASNSNYTSQNIKIFTGENVTCPLAPVRVEDMNYPSFSAVFNFPPSLLPVAIDMTRTVTNVGNANTTYTATIVGPSSLSANISVEPSILTFGATNDSRLFTVLVTTVNAPNATLANTSVTDFAYLVWSDGKHNVQSPISITLQK